MNGRFLIQKYRSKVVCVVEETLTLNYSESRKLFSMKINSLYHALPGHRTAGVNFRLHTNRGRLGPIN